MSLKWPKQSIIIYSVPIYVILSQRKIIPLCEACAGNTRICSSVIHISLVLFVLTAVNSDETVDVTYVDFGNSERLPFADIRKLPDMFLRLSKQVRGLNATKFTLEGHKPYSPKQNCTRCVKGRKEIY